MWGGGGRGDQDLAGLVLTGFGISVSEMFVISEDSRCCVKVRISAPRIAANRSLTSMDENILLVRANDFLVNYS